MNIFAAIKKAINSDLNKPLNETLDEIKLSVDNVRKATRYIKTVIGIPYNAKTSEQALTLDDAPVFSIEGSGRILHIIPATTSNTARLGTVLLTVDDEIILNNQISYGISGGVGRLIVSPDSGQTLTLGIFDKIYSTYSFNCYPIFREDVTTYSTENGGIISPVGVPFKNGFELRLTQSMGTPITIAGVIVVYELYE